jgi:septal ring factor EnvC (AmiA/AmiB activator)
MILPTFSIRTIFLSVFLASWLSGMFAAELQAKQASQADLDKLNSHISKLNKELAGHTDQRSKQLNILKKTELSIAGKQKAIRRINTKLSSQQKNLDSLLKQQAKLDEQKIAQQALIEQQIVDAYKMGRQSKLKMLLNQENPEQLARALVYYNYFNEARVAQIQQYIETLKELEQVAPAISAETKALKTSRQQLQQQHKQLLADQQNRKQALQKLEDTIKSKNQQLAATRENRKKLIQLLESMQQAVAHIQVPKDYQPFHKAKGSMRWPVKGRLKNSFGRKRSQTSLRWQGITIGASAGTPVAAIYHGRVVYADWFRGAGLLLILDHGDGYMSLYAHNQTLVREIGDWVSAGEQIATVGNSGGQQQDGLYFEIRHNSEPQNPKKWCSTKT